MPLVNWVYYLRWFGSFAQAHKNSEKTWSETVPQCLTSCFCCSGRLCLHRGHGGCAEAAGPSPSGPARAGMSAAPRRPPAGRTSPFNIASPPTDCWSGFNHFLQHQDPWWCSHAQTIPGDAGSHDGLSLGQNAAESEEDDALWGKTHQRFRLEWCVRHGRFYYRINNKGGDPFPLFYRLHKLKKMMRKETSCIHALKWEMVINSKM